MLFPVRLSTWKTALWSHGFAPTLIMFQTYNKKGASRRKEHLKDHQNGSATAVNGHTSSFSALENSVKPRKQRKD